MKACTYIRVSTQRQNFSGLGQQAQRDICMSYIKTSGYEFVKEFSDVESGKNRNRIGLMQAIDYCKKNECKLVFARLDRLARDVEFTFKVINTGIKVHFCDMPQLNTLILGVMATVAQYERELISQRTKAALRAKKEQLKETGGTTDLWGSKNGNKNRSDAINKAASISATNRREIARQNPANKAFWEFIADYQAINGDITANTDFKPIAEELNRRGKVTAKGLPFNANRARVMYYKVKEMYNY